MRDMGGEWRMVGGSGFRLWGGVGWGGVGVIGERKDGI